ncbi:zinc finger MYM-type protein 2-like [Mizuhopecten yessoensis]|uniref:zinc finger MYM-type protein 2-like n=1 Tax=Mizuhopecten yessoensis TaxID=6573 RepID=UPI000B45DD15|nr:zinc finger MYM-type protein 2-like [Mizuhopecten yessoensis]
MSSDSEGVFLTQSTFTTENTVVDTDEILSDVLDLQKENITPRPNFNILSEMFSDISEDEMTEITQVVEEVETRRRFAIPMQDGDLKKIVAGESCVNTENKTKWALKVFDSWIEQRLIQSKNNEKLKNFPNNLLDLPVSDINEALTYFVAEVRNKNGEEYRPNTLYELIISIQHYFRQNGRFVNILDDTEFAGLRGVLDARMKNLAKQGLGINKKQAEIITEEQEQLMWEKGVLGTDTPEKLLNTLVYQLGLNLSLRAGQEHRNLRCGPYSQITVKQDSAGKTYLEYREDVSKTNAGGLLHRKVTPKVTRAYENTVLPDQCPVKIYQKFMSLR